MDYGLMLCLWGIRTWTYDSKLAESERSGPWDSFEQPTIAHDLVIFDAMPYDYCNVGKCNLPAASYGKVASHITGVDDALVFAVVLWWDDHRGKFDLHVSQFVMEEASAGDPEAATRRLAVLVALPQLDVTDAVQQLAPALLTLVPLPANAQVDALHIAVATVHGMDYLVPWNCTHIANATLRNRIEVVCRATGYEPPTICTPQELLET